MAENQVSTNKFSCAKWIVDANGVSAGATHSTIASAITSAVSGETIFIKPGTYTENLTLVAGVNLISFVGDGRFGQVEIVGTLTVTFIGNVSITGIKLTTNGANALTTSGTNASILELNNCVIDAADFAAIGLSNANATVTINNSHVDVSSATHNIFVIVTGQLIFRWCIIESTGGSAADSTIAAGSVSFFSVEGQMEITTSVTGSVTILDSNIDQTNKTFLTTAGTASSLVIRSSIATGNASSIVIGTGTTVQCLNSDLDSSNTNVVSGAGTFDYSDVTFSGSSVLIDVSTPTIISSHYTDLGKYLARLQPAFYAYNSANDLNQTGAGTAVTVEFDTERFDQSSNFNTTTDTFTAPVTGIYRFTTKVSIAALTSAMTAILTELVTTSTTIELERTNPYAVRDSAGIYSTSGSATVLMTATNTAYVRVTIANGAGDTATIRGGGANLSYFCGELIC